MRMKKAWIVARKDLSEFRANKQILLTLAVFPIMMAVIPTLAIIPLAGAAYQPPAPEPTLPLHLAYFWNDSELRDTTLNDAWVNHSTIAGGYVNNSYINNSTLLNVVVHGSLLDNVTVSNAVIIGSVLRNSHYDASTCQLVDTTLSGTTVGPAETLKFLFDYFTKQVLLFLFFIMAVAMPTTIAAFSFVGEKSNKTLEPLLATPLTDAELLFGKYLAVFVPVILLIFLSFAIFAVIVDVFTLPMIGYLLVPDALWAVTIFVDTPLICMVGIAMNVLISSKVNDVRTAQQYSAFLVVPVMMVFFIGPITGMTFIGLGFMLILAAVLLGFMALLAWLSLKVFNREGILTRWK
jgi:ABC-2 type transport system permease protein